MIGQQVSHYRVVAELGRGGMGVVYLAEDANLGRKVALKFLKPDVAQDAASRTRFVREARAASALDHPHIATIYEIGEWDGRLFIAMAYYEGETLAARIERGPLSVGEAAGIFAQLASALARAHAAGIVHRDLKPANVILTLDGPAKVLDFGLAKLLSGEADTATRMTQTGTTLGTVAYMSPEQAHGEDVDHHADLWALGVVAYEMLTGQRPFRGVHPAAVVHAIIHETPPAPATLRPQIPDELSRVVVKALAREQASRYQSAAEMLSAVEAWHAAAEPSGASARPSMLASLRRPAVALPAAAVVIIAAMLAVRAISRARLERWAREGAVPEISRLVEAEKFAAAFSLARRAEVIVPAEPTLARLWPIMSRTITLHTDPPGAQVSLKEYASSAGEWQTVGVTPLDGVQVPAGYFRWKLEEPGYRTIELAFASGPVPPSLPLTFRFTMDRDADAPPGMVRIPDDGASYRLFLPGFEHLPPTRLADFWIDKYEVTNQQYKAFADAGGYQKRKYWQERFIKDGRELSWTEAMAMFRDATGRPGPRTWVQGEYPSGQATHPVTGVSWHEATAYARFAGKQIPTLYHWTRAAETRAGSFVIPLSNFGDSGPWAVGSHQGLHAWGAYDMAGNVKEWVWNDAGDGRRYILGGAWDEPSYMFNEPDARSPFDRDRSFGFRCVKYVQAPGQDLTAVVVWPTRDYKREKPVPDRVFDIYRSFYSYDRTPVSARIDAVTDGDDWRREKITFPAAYGNEQVVAHLFLPKALAPPYMTVVYWPGANTLRLRSIEQWPSTAFDFIVKSGRAVLVPTFRGMFERKTEIDDSTANPTSSYRDHVIAWAKDFGRSIDYLETRKDITLDRLGFVGLSWGGRMGSIMPALDSRVKVVVLILGGFSMQRALPEVDQINFAPRTKIPTLMLNGRYDFFFPVEASQRPMFETLGTPKEHKRHILYDTGHGIPRLEMIKETLDWLDKYQGAPATAATTATPRS